MSAWVATTSPNRVHVYVEIIYIDSSPDPDIFAPYVYRNPSDEFIWRLYGYPSKENYYISDYRSQERQESSITSQLVEH